MKPALNRFICRVEHPSGNSGFYWVRFFQTFDCSERVQCTFTDLEWGSKQKALDAAREWRDQMADELGIELAVCSNFKRKQTKPRSNTGVVGVVHLDYVKGCGRHVTAYTANWSETQDDGKRKPRQKMFGYKPDQPWDKDRAFKQAVEHRAKMEKTHYRGGR